MTFVTVIEAAVLALGIGLIIGSFIIEGMPRLPPGPIFLSGFYILLLGVVATVLSMIVA